MNAFHWRGPSIVFHKQKLDAKFRNRGTNKYGQTGAPLDMPALLAYRRSGKTYAQCGHAFGVDESTAYRRIKSYEMRALQ